MKKSSIALTNKQTKKHSSKHVNNKIAKVFIEKIENGLIIYKEKALLIRSDKHKYKIELWIKSNLTD